MSKAFLSYTHSDRSFVEQLARDILRTGIDVFLDTWEIAAGESIVAKINEGIDTSDFLVVVLSHASIDSKWVRHELNSALMLELDSRQITVIPLRIDDVGIPPMLADKKYVDFRSSYDDALNELVAALLQQRQVKKSVIPVITYSPAHGPTRELSKDSFVYPGSSEFVEGVFVPFGLRRVEIVLVSPDSNEAELYSYFFEKYDTHELEVSPSVSACDLDGLDVAKWKVTIDDVEDANSAETRRLITTILDAHNQQVAKVVSLFNMLNSFVGQSSLSTKMRSPMFDGAAFLDAVKGNDDICKLMNERQIAAFAGEMEASMARAEGVEIEVEEFFSQAFPFIILTAYLKAKYPENAVAYARVFAGLEAGETPLTDRERNMLPMLEFWAIVSQESLRQVWAEFKIEHLSPNEADALEQFFVKQGMAGALHKHGGVLGMFRLAATDSFDAYFMLLAALQGVRS